MAGHTSSFNHMTNIHAEMASIVMATMSDDPEVVALALIRAGAKGDLPRPCGVCRQFLHEHALRTGRDIVVIMGSLDGLDIECEPTSNLLPKSWFAAKRFFRSAGAALEYYSAMSCRSPETGVWGPGSHRGALSFHCLGA